MVDEQEFINQTILRLRSGYYIQEGGASAERDINKLVDIGLICKAEVERLKTNIQLLGDELNSLADRYDNLDDENTKLKEVVEKRGNLLKYWIEKNPCICSAFSENLKCYSCKSIDALKGLEVEK